MESGAGAGWTLNETLACPARAGAEDDAVRAEPWLAR
jgi:hypothetical protein